MLPLACDANRPFTYVTLYNPDSLDKNLCDKRIFAITNIETKNKTNKPIKNVPYNTS